MRFCVHSVGWNAYFRIILVRPDRLARDHPGFVFHLLTDITK
jgi:hypothetical protein